MIKRDAYSVSEAALQTVGMELHTARIGAFVVRIALVAEVVDASSDRTSSFLREVASVGDNLEDHVRGVDRSAKVGV